MASNACQALNDPGESLCVDNINRDMLDSGTLQGYIDNLSVTGLTSYPTIFDHAISESATYDGEIQRQKGRGQSGEGLFFNLTAQDLARAAELFALVHSRTATVDGFVSLEVSPLLAGIDVAALASKLQSDDAKGFATSWNKLLAAIDAKIKGLCLMPDAGERMPTTSLTHSPAWQAFATHHRQIKNVHLRTLFGDDPGRAMRLSADGAGLFLDYSKTASPT